MEEKFTVCIVRCAMRLMAVVFLGSVLHFMGQPVLLTRIAGMRFYKSCCWERWVKLEEARNCIEESCLLGGTNSETIKLLKC